MKNQLVVPPHFEFRIPNCALAACCLMVVGPALADPPEKPSGTRIVQPLVVQASYAVPAESPPQQPTKEAAPPIFQVPPATNPPTTAPTSPAKPEQEPLRLPNINSQIPSLQPQTQAKPLQADPFAPRARLNALDAPIGSTPKPDQQTLEKYRSFVESIDDPDNTLDLVVGRPRILQLKKAPVKYQAVDPTVADIEVINKSGDKAFFVLGKQPGTTVIALFFADPAAPDKFRVLNYLVRVVPDPEAKNRLERVYKALEDEINHAFPDSVVKLCLVGDKLVVSGQAKDVNDAAQIIRIVRSQAPQEPPAAKLPVDRVDVTVTPNPLNPDQTIPQGLQNFVVSGGANVINLLRVPGEQQVMLRVTVAEVNRAALRSIGMNFSLFNKNQLRVFGQLTGATQLSPNLPAVIDNGQVQLAINALRNLNFARTLAEPSLTTLSGQAATFQAGGEFPVPVVSGFTANGLQGVSFVPFGVQLSFTPIVFDKDRIRLTINAEVSTRNTDPQQQTNINGAQISSLDTRRFTNVVELREGQTLAVAGLIQNNYGANANRVPLFGDLPLIGRAFAFDQATSGEQEVVFLITPELVHPMEHNEVPPLPGYNVFEPGDTEFYLYGRLEGRRTEDYRAGARTDIHRMLNYHNCVDQYITGPFGPTSGPEVKVQPGPNNVVLPSAGTLPMPKPQPSTSSTASPSAGVPQPPR
jgi:pilus assembly protein CpaC